MRKVCGFIILSSSMVFPTFIAMSQPTSSPPCIRLPESPKSLAVRELSIALAEYIEHHCDLEKTKISQSTEANGLLKSAQDHLKESEKHLDKSISSMTDNFVFTVESSIVTRDSLQTIIDHGFEHPQSYNDLLVVFKKSVLTARTSLEKVTFDDDVEKFNTALRAINDIEIKLDEDFMAVSNISVYNKRIYRLKG